MDAGVCQAIQLIITMVTLTETGITRNARLTTYWLCQDTGVAARDRPDEPVN